MQNEPPGATPGTPASAETGAALSAAALSVVRGQPSPAEVAAIVAVLAVRAAASAQASAGREHAARSRSSWSDKARLLRDPVVAGRGGWHASALPR